MSSVWSEAGNVTSSIVVKAQDGKKQNYVLDILRWFESELNINVKKQDVYFFDDREDNVKPFNGTGMNAQQISCNSRDGEIGACGGLVKEVTQKQGVHLCAASSMVV